MGNKNSKGNAAEEGAINNNKPGNKKKKKKRTRSREGSTSKRASLSSRIRSSFSSNHGNSTRQYTYAEFLKLIEDELCNYVPFDLSILILSFIPRSTIGDESNPISPYDVLNVRVHIISPYKKIPCRVLSIFNAVSPNCHCGAVLNEKMFYDKTAENEEDDSNETCDQCHKFLLNRMIYYECPSMNSSTHKNNYQICSKCINSKINIYQINDGNLFDYNTYYEPIQNQTTFDCTTKLCSTLQSQRRVCLAFTEDYVRVYLHCFRNPSSIHSNQYFKALYTSDYEWRIKSNKFAMNERQIAILMDDFSNTNWDKKGKYWLDYMEKWSGGENDGIYVAMCHCNQINNKINMNQKMLIEDYLYKKKTQKHGNIHDEKNKKHQKSISSHSTDEQKIDMSFDEKEFDKKNLRKPWKRLNSKLFQCSITENEDTITAVLDIVGGFLSNLTEEEKVKLTYRGKFNKTKK